MAVNHIEMTLIYRQIDGFADSATRVMQAWAHIGQFDEVTKIFDGGVASTAIQIANKG